MEGMCRSTGGCSQDWRESVLFSTRALGTSESVVASNSNLYLSLVNQSLDFEFLFMGIFCLFFIFMFWEL